MNVKSVYVFPLRVCVCLYLKQAINACRKSLTAGLCNRVYHGKPRCWCVWNKFIGKYEKGVLWSENVSCPEEPGALNDLWKKKCIPRQHHQLPMTQLVETLFAPFLSLRSWRPKTCSTLWQSMQRTEKCLVSALFEFFFFLILLVKMNVGEIIWSWYSDSVLKYPLSLQTTWPQMAVWAKMRHERSFGRFSQPLTTATATTSFTVT